MLSDPARLSELEKSVDDIPVPEIDQYKFVPLDIFSVLIVVVVAIDTVTQVQTRLMSSQYEQLIKKTKFGR